MGKVFLQAKDLDVETLMASVRDGDEVVLMEGERSLGRFVPEAGAQAGEDRPLPRFGSLKGKIHLDESFWDPLPEDELRLWEGHGD